MQPSMLSADFQGFGYRELDLAADLLKEYANHPPMWLAGYDIKIGMNVNSGNVFLYNDDGDVGMLNNGRIERFDTCPNCGAEDFYPALTLDDNREYCNFCRPSTKS